MTNVLSAIGMHLRKCGYNIVDCKPNPCEMLFDMIFGMGEVRRSAILDINTDFICVQHNTKHIKTHITSVVGDSDLVKLECTSHGEDGSLCVDCEIKIDLTNPLSMTMIEDHLKSHV